MQIRSVKETDAAAIAAIYAPYVRETAITFEYDAPSAATMLERIQETTTKFPYLVAEIDGSVVGYAYAHTYYPRAAYDWTVEVSIYIDTSQRQAGLGTALYDTLEKQLKEQGFVNLLACISLPNDPSIAFHQKRGYKQVAHFEQVGYKFDRWYDIVWLQKSLAKK